jgi:hypothetical protein
MRNGNTAKKINDDISKTHTMEVQQLTMVTAKCRSGGVENNRCASQLRNGGTAIKSFAG